MAHIDENPLGRHLPLDPLPGHSSRGRLERVLRRGEFAVTAELNPPDSANPEDVYERAAIFEGWVDGINAVDASGANCHMSSVGICALLIIYLLLIGRGLVITAQAQTLFGKLLAGSLTMTFFVYVFVNIGMVSGLLPVVGVPLPFISYGGTSLVTLLSAFGVLMSIHTHRKWIAQV